MPRSERHHGSAQGQLSLSDIVRDIKAMNSSILLISQKMQYIVRNEKILGQNLVILNKKIKEVETKGVSSVGGGISSEEIGALQEKLNQLNSLTADLGNELDKLKSQMVSREEFLELKHLIDAINPLEFASIEQVKEMLGEKKKK
ncbi:MAG: hypothetical protein Q7S21_03770 [archaeon]|nr:hypothetical protein [archaeon]